MLQQFHKKASFGSLFYGAEHGSRTCLWSRTWKRNESYQAKKKKDIFMGGGEEQPLWLIRQEKQTAAKT